MQAFGSYRPKKTQHAANGALRALLRQSRAPPANEAEKRKRFRETEMEYGRADRELCEYAAKYLATRI